MNGKDHKTFWQEVRKGNGKNFDSPTVIDGKDNEIDICNMFSEKYKEIFNKKSDTSFTKTNMSNISEKKKTEILLKFSKSDVIRGIRDWNWF